MKKIIAVVFVLFLALFLFEVIANNQDTTIQLYKGWNLISYPKESSYRWFNATLTDGVETRTVYDNVWIQPTIYYWDSTRQMYAFVPGNDDYMYPDKGYWVYALQNVTLIFS